MELLSEPSRRDVGRAKQVQTRELVLKKGILSRASGFCIYPSTPAIESRVKRHHDALEQEVERHEEQMGRQALIEGPCTDEFSVLRAPDRNRDDREVDASDLFVQAR